MKPDECYIADISCIYNDDHNGVDLVFKKEDISDKSLFRFDDEHNYGFLTRGEIDVFHFAFPTLMKYTFDSTKAVYSYYLGAVCEI
jgi:hypothetical protein